MDVSKIILIYLGVQALFFIGFLIISKVKDKRLKASHGKRIPHGYVKTEEVMLDPSSGKRLTVYYNPETGSRFYHEE